ncbi:hypothetical protein ACJMK2_032188 [Sinanodonta woodiana]|uniref:C-type lectin domain-containing protein n=1 Tax=Sinanodonta woodiana TaxID=1069815 RepID=A0ABD3X1J1_SINWO
MIITISLLILLTPLKWVANAVSDVPNDRSVDMFFGDSFCQNIIQQDLTNAVKSVCAATSKGAVTSSETYRAMATRVEAVERKLDVALSKVSNISVNPCRFGYDYYKADNFCYRYHRECKNWTDARQVCQKHGGDLIMLKENNFNFFKDLARLKANECSHVWVGTTDINTPSVWKWLNGDSIPAVFWAPTQPDFQQSKEHCGDLQKFYDYGLNDEDCSNKMNFICQIVF